MWGDEERSLTIVKCSAIECHSFLSFVGEGILTKSEVRNRISKKKYS